MSEVNNKEFKPEAPKVDTRKREINKFSIIFNKMGIWVIVIMLLLIGTIVSKGEFFTSSNIQSILEAVALLGMIAPGMFFVVYCGNMNDMGIPSTMALAGMMTVQTINFGFPVAFMIGILTGITIGVVNGFMIGKLRANAVIWPLAMNLFISGVIRVVWEGKQLYADSVAKDTAYAQNAAQTFYSISRTYIGGIISLMAIVMLVMMIIAWFIHSKTTFGQKVKIMGTNYEVAKCSGINTVKVTMLVYIIDGICASVGGIFYAALRKTASYENGTGYDFTALTAVCLGGALLSGGKGSIVGTFGGVIAYGILNNILSWVGLGTYEKYLVQGLVFLFIVWLNAYSNRKLGKA